LSAPVTVTSVRLGQYAVGGEGDRLETLGLGSCVAIVLHDPVAQVGGMAHVLLPDPAHARDRSNPARFATTAVDLLIDELARLGASPARLEARLAGGAAMFAALMTPGTIGMGERNLSATRGALAARGIRVHGEATGGERGRSVRFWPGSGRVVVSSVGYDAIEL
jgi:chemotaxis protein CheD